MDELLKGAKNVYPFAGPSIHPSKKEKKIRMI
jgi:hypothetical protein